MMFAALIAGTVCTAGFPASAQNTTTTNPPAAGARPAGSPALHGRTAFDVIASRLALTDEQRTNAKPVVDDMMKKLTELRKDSSVAQADRAAKVKEIRDVTTAQLKGILTADQLAQWERIAPGTRPIRPTPAGGTTNAPAAKPQP